MAGILCFASESAFFVIKLLWNHERIDSQVLKVPYRFLGYVQQDVVSFP